MTRRSQPHFLLVSGFGQKAGKTTIARSIIRSLCEKHYRVRAFKLGADPVDASLLSSMAGHICYNLDPYLMSIYDIAVLLYKSANEADFIIIEATLGINSSLTSFFNKKFMIPTLHVESYTGETSYIVTLTDQKRRYRRHKGVQFVFDTDDPSTAVRQIIEYLKRCKKYNLVQTPISELELPHIQGQILVAVDEAFGIACQNNIHYLLSASARVTQFSPLRDSSIMFRPTYIYLGSGNISPYVPDLSRNNELLIQLRHFADEGTIIYADGDAVTYLMDFAIGQDGQHYSMLGLLPGFTRPKERERSYGHCIALSITGNILCEAGQILPVYFDSDRETTFTSPVETCFLISTYNNKCYLGVDGVRRGDVFATEFRAFWGTRTQIGQAEVGVNCSGMSRNPG